MPREPLKITAAPPPHPDSSSHSATGIAAIVISSTVFAVASLYFLFRHLKRRRSNLASYVVQSPVIVDATSSSELINSLPAFTFGSVAGNLTGGDCAVCLSKFERKDLLRLLPLCCHAFHAPCIDTWLSTNHNCPLCRSTVNLTEDEILNKIRSQTSANNSFRVEIGSLSRHLSNGSATHIRSYSIGEFDYIVDDGSTVVADYKSDRFAPSAPEIPPEGFAGGSSRSWLKDYVDRLSSRRFFTGSSRRSEAMAVSAVAAVDDDIETDRAGAEISEFFRWLSGV